MCESDQGTLQKQYINTNSNQSAWQTKSIFRFFFNLFLMGYVDSFEERERAPKELNISCFVKKKYLNIY